MILTGSEIKKQHVQKRIHIFPFSEKCLNPNSYNYRLNDQLLEIIDVQVDPRVKNKYRRIQLKEDGFLLQPGHLYLGSTFEEMGSSHYVTTLMGRSSLGRLGLFLQITADLGQLGTRHRWTLELKVVQPLMVYPMMEIGQVCFWAVEGRSGQYYCGKYHRNATVRCSKIYQEF